MNKLLTPGLLAVVLGMTGFVYSATSSAQLTQSSSSRTNKWEFMVEARYLEGRDIGFEAGSVELDSEPAFGFGFGYNFNQHLALHMDFSWASIDYLATRASGGSYRGELDTTSTQFNLSYYLFSGPLTPFVAGGMGWTWVDTNIPSGPPGVACDPWYYYCYSYQSTYSETEFSYNAALGLRWDVSRKVFLRASVGKLWIDFDRSSSAPSFTNGRFDLGFMF